MLALSLTARWLQLLLFSCTDLQAAARGSLTAHQRMLSDLWDAHCRYEFAEGHKSVENTMATMVEDAYVNHVPTMVGGFGQKDLTHFYAEHFIFANPAINLTTVSRTIREDQLVEELVLSLNHDRMVHWMLPGVPPTGRHITVPLVAIVRFAVDPTDEKWKLKHEHIYWDQASVLEQLGLLKNFVHTYPGVALGAVQAQSVLLGQGANAGRQSRGEAPEAEL